MKGALTGSTLWIFGLRDSIIMCILFALFFIASIVDLVLKGPGHGRAHEIHGKSP
jgi:hypothetical protein